MFGMAEMFGYIASFFVAISLVMSSFIWLRVLNLVGAISFVVYGSMIGSVPIVITNGFITIINVYYLIQMFRPDLNGVQYVPIGPNRRDRLDDFVAYYYDDIVHFFPDFSDARIDECFAAGGTAYLALKELRLVGFALVHSVPSSADSTGDARDEVTSFGSTAVSALPIACTKRSSGRRSHHFFSLRCAERRENTGVFSFTTGSS